MYQGVVPDDLMERVEPLVVRPAEASIDSVRELPAAIERLVEHYHYGKHESGTETVPLVVDERERAAHEELATILRLIDAGWVAVSDRTRRPTSAAVRVVTSMLDTGDNDADDELGPIRAFAWPLLVQAAGLAERAGRSFATDGGGSQGARRAGCADAAPRVEAMARHAAARRAEPDRRDQGARPAKAGAVSPPPPDAAR